METTSKKTDIINVPVIQQMPTYQRGCSIASLAMILNHANVKTSISELSNNITKNPEKYKVEDGITYFGNPYNGFVGDIYKFSNPGLGVYYPPILELMQKYLNNVEVGYAVNLTNADFEIIEQHLKKGYPIWVMVNAKYKKLPKTDFLTWITENGEIKITKWMHSVVLTGTDTENVYFSDPLNRHKKALKKDFIEAWEQMGKQALSYEKI